MKIDYKDLCKRNKAVHTCLIDQKAIKTSSNTNDCEKKRVGEEKTVSDKTSQLNKQKQSI